MTTDARNTRGLVYRVLMVAALVTIAIAYFSPIWWVSLTAPQYPEEAFPDGIRIHFHFDSVRNGCTAVERAELDVDDTLDCKHEMDAINHYVGMYPIAAGAPVERAFSPFMVSLVGVMLIAFMAPGRKAQIGVLAVGGGAIAVWMSLAMFTEGGAMLLSPGFMADTTGTMDLDSADYAHWTGLKAIEESYLEGLGRYFRETEKIEGMVGTMIGAAKVVYVLMLLAIAALVAGMLILPKITYWALGLIPAVLPIAFVIDYSAWLYWFGHNLNEMGAFTVKPFMPTVFGQGKVAQFSTFSYPEYGFGLLVLSAVLIVLGVLIRRKQLREAES